MSNWWIVLVVVVIAAAGVLYYMRSRREQRDDVIVGAASTRDYEQEREDNRVGQMSIEDRAWEAASQQKNRETQERQEPLPPAS